MQRYSTHQVPAVDKVAYWNGVITGLFAPLETTPLGQGEFDAQLSSVALGRSHLTHIESKPASICRRATLPAPGSARKYLLHMQLEGRLQIAQDGHESWIEPGDLLLSDSSQPYTLHHDEPCTTLVLSIHAEQLKHHVPAPEQVLGLKLSSHDGFTQTTANLMQGVWRQAQAPMSAEVGDRVADSILNMYATTLLSTQATPDNETAVATSRRVLITRFIESHLRDSELSAKRVASEFGISVRYLHMLFSSSGETVADYILRRRLEHCMKQLRDTLWAKRTIIEIAFGWGFQNATHFARVFRNHSGMSPREYRAAAREQMAVERRVADLPGR